MSICHLVIRLLQPSAKILFYCHYPDQLLSDRSSLLKRLYRLPFDLTEEVTTGLADVIVCNSKFSRSVFRDTFRLLRHVAPGVLHPCVDLDSIKRCAVPCRVPCGPPCLHNISLSVRCCCAAPLPPAALARVAAVPGRRLATTTATSSSCPSTGSSARRTSRWRCWPWRRCGTGWTPRPSPACTWWSQVATTGVCRRTSSTISTSWS